MALAPASLPMLLTSRIHARLWTAETITAYKGIFKQTSATESLPVKGCLKKAEVFAPNGYKFLPKKIPESHMKP